MTKTYEELLAENKDIKTQQLQKSIDRSVEA